MISHSYMSPRRDVCHMSLYKYPTYSAFFFAAAGYFFNVAAAFSSPSRAARGISGPGKFTRAPGPGLVPVLSVLPQSCAAWRTKGSGLAQPLILAAIVRIRSVAEAPMPPQSSHAARYPGGRAGFPSCAETAKLPSLSILPFSTIGCAARKEASVRRHVAKRNRTAAVGNFIVAARLCCQEGKL